MPQPAATGERQALRGYRWQYDHIAALVYDALYDQDLVSLRLTDPDAGRVDDLVLKRCVRTDAYQFKSAENDGYITFNQFIRNQKTRSGAQAPSLAQSLADGWKLLQSQSASTHVHLVMQQLASPNDRLGIKGGSNRPRKYNFSSFLKQVLEPLRMGKLTLDEVAADWQDALAKLQEASGVAPEDFGLFLQQLHLDLNAGRGIPQAPSVRKSDILALSDALSRLVSEASGVVELDEAGVLSLMGWTERTRLHSRHEFPVDLETYAPLAEAIDQLKGIAAKHDSGYIAVIGPPGAGKSTLLSQALTSSTDRVVRYYAYVPKTAAGVERLTGRGYLHDIVLMLRGSGLSPQEHQMTGRDVRELRQQLAEQLDSANREFAETRRRTILVVDGLDHVDRDYTGSDGLLNELPRPEELPPGVLFVVGARTLDPLRAHARQQLEERQTIVDLRHHTLSPASTLDICRRAQVTADLAPELHLRIAELSGGYPLALSYLLNRLRDTDSSSAEEVLAAAPAYQGDIAAEYRTVWDEIKDDADVVDILAVCSRLRVGFTTEWLSEWKSDAAVMRFRSNLLYLFRKHYDGWRFFHDSFRQFASDHTAFGDDGSPDADADARAHGRVAELCGTTDDSRVAAEQLYHRYCAREEDEVLRLAEQTRFREQYRQLRSPALIREDIRLALGIAAERADVLATFRLLLSLWELSIWTSSLDSVDMPSLLYETGLGHEAIAYCSGDDTRAPLEQVFSLAARLGADNDPAGLRIFRSIEHEGPNASRGAAATGQEHDVAVAWTRAAALFLPLSAVISTLRNFAVTPLATNRRDRNDQIEHWERYVQTMEALIDAVVQEEEETDLEAIDTALAEIVPQLTTAVGRGDADSDRWSQNDVDRITAAVVDLRVRLRVAILHLAATDEAEARHIGHLLSTFNGLPRQASTTLDVAEVLIHHGRGDRARGLLEASPYRRTLTVGELGPLRGSAALDCRFRYWRLCYRLARNDDEIPAPIPPAMATPAGNDISPSSSVHGDVAAIELVTRVDSAIRRLGQLDAAVASGSAPFTAEERAELVRLLDLFESSASRATRSLSSVRGQKPELIRIIAAVALRHGNGLPEQLRGELADRFKKESWQSSTKLKLDLADDFSAAGVEVPWYREALAELESGAIGGDVFSRLDFMAELARRHADCGDQQSAQRMITEMIPMAFGVGFRKDHQFDDWVDWLGQALAEPGGDRFVDDAAWMARLLVAVEPMTEGAPRSATACLPAAVVPVSPMSGVRLFEYLVRQGTVRHFEALAALVCAVVEHTKANDKAAIELAAEFTAELLAPAAQEPFPMLASALVRAAERMVGQPFASALAESIVVRTDCYALPTARAGWRQGLGLGTDADGDEDDHLGMADHDDYFALVLSDGQQIKRGEVASHINTVDDLIALRRMETDGSNYSWTRLIERRTLMREDVPKLIEAFEEGPRADPDVLALLAEAAERHGDQEVALRLALTAFSSARGYTWAHYFGGTRLRVASLIVRLGNQSHLRNLCQDLVRNAIETPWIVGQLLASSRRIVQTLDPQVQASSIWAETRTYLEGMAETLALAGDEPLADGGCWWWLTAPSDDEYAPVANSTHGGALAEIAVKHLSHASWLVREGASTVVVRGLVAGNVDIAESLARFAPPHASDDILERAGRCLAAARVHDGFVSHSCLEQLDQTLATHPSQILRDLAAARTQADVRPLSQRYQITLPAGAIPRVGSGEAIPGPYELLYEVLADELNLDLTAMIRIASEYATTSLAALPGRDAVFESLKRSDVRHVITSEELAASRAAAGRVMADVLDAGLLDHAPTHIRRLFRTFDIDLVDRRPRPRPSVVPPPPPTGVDKTIEWWLAGVESRLSEYVAAVVGGDEVLIGASSRLRILNWDYLSEEHECGVCLGPTQPAEANHFALGRSMYLRDLATPTTTGSEGSGELLIVKNFAPRFHQFDTEWISFRSDLAAMLGWKPDLMRPSSWNTSSGELAVQTIRWVDGWWGHTGQSFDDVEAEGYAVVLTSPGLRELSAAFGKLTLNFTLKRFGMRDGAAVVPVSANRSLPINGSTP